MAPHIDDALLDDPDEMVRKDSRGTLRALATAGAQTREALTLSHEAGIDRLTSDDRPRSVLVAALGGSAVVADVLELLAEPVRLCRCKPVAICPFRVGSAPSTSSWLCPCPVGRPDRWASPLRLLVEEPA